MLTILRKIEKWIHALSRASAYIGITVVLLMTLVTTVDVFGRYVFSSPIAGSVDIIEIMMVIMVYSGFALCASRNGHVRVDSLYGKFSKRIQAYLDIVNSLLSVVFVGLMAWQLGVRAWGIVINPPGPATGYFQWPLLPFIAFAALGSGLLCLEFLVWFFHSLSLAITTKDLNEDSALTGQESPGCAT